MVFSFKAFLNFLRLLIIQSKEINKVIFKATDYNNAISFISLKSG